MKLVAIFGLASAALSLAALYFRRKAEAIDSLPQATIKPADISAVERALKRSPEKFAFAAFMFESPDWDPTSDEAAPNVQMSWEDGVLFVDWVLVAEPNIRAEPRIRTFLIGLGLTAQRRRENGVDFLRVSTGDPSELCRVIIESCRDALPADELRMVYQGFSWDAA